MRGGFLHGNDLQFMKNGHRLSRECLNLSCLPKPSFADMACRVGDMSATCLCSCRRLGRHCMSTRVSKRHDI